MSASEPERIRAGARAYLTSIRKVLDAREGKVTLHHVRSHTGGMDRDSKFNHIADRQANQGRESSPTGTRRNLFTHNEERVLIFLNDHGDFRTWARDAAASNLVDTWAQSGGKHTGRVAGMCGDGVARRGFARMPRGGSYADLGPGRRARPIAHCRD